MADGVRTSFGIISVGALGGMFPTLLRLAIGLSQGQMSPSDVHASLLLAMAIFAVCGGIVAAVWGEVDLKKVFYLGIGLPSFLTVMTSTASSPAVVHAQGTASQAPSELSLSLPLDVANSNPQIVFRSENGTSVVPFNSKAGTVKVPPGTTSFSVQSARGDSDVVALPPAKKTLNFRAEADPWYGFKYAFGVNGAKPQKLVPETQ